MAILVHELPDDVDALKRMLIAARDELADVKSEIANLKLQIAKLQRMQFGRSSEKVAAQIEQLELALDALEADRAEREAQRESKAEAARDKPEKQKSVRKPLPAHLPRETVVHEGPCACPACGGALSKLGEDVTEVLEVEKRFKVIRHVRPKLSCRKCEADRKSVV